MKLTRERLKQIIKEELEEIVGDRRDALTGYTKAELRGDKSVPRSYSPTRISIKQDLEKIGTISRENLEKYFNDTGGFKDLVRKREFYNSKNIQWNVFKDKNELYYVRRPGTKQDILVIAGNVEPLLKMMNKEAI